MIPLSETTPAREEITDSRITRAIEHRLLLDEGISTQRIDVDTYEGIVTLTGSIDNLLAKDHALQIAKSIRGVRAVVDQVLITALPRSDADIKGDIEDALLMDPATPSDTIDVKVVDGVATLTGKVESFQEKELASEVTKGVRGVIAVENKLLIEYTTKRSDLEIKADILGRLHADVWLAHDWLLVDVRDGNATLSGTVGSAFEKSLAFRHSWVRGVLSVNADAVAVEPWARDKMLRESKEPHRSDAEIKKALEDAFFYDPRVTTFHPNVEVEDGLVILTGVVDNLRAKRAAEWDASNTTGVRRVKNYLRVRTAEVPDDTEIAAEVKKALTRDPIVERHEIRSYVMNGKVFLSGMVDSNFEKCRADNIASALPGVAHVENNITVRSREIASWEARPDISDQEIEDDIEELLFWSSFVGKDKIKVEVEDRVATLSGFVEDRAEMEAARECALRGGAARVNNLMRIRKEIRS